MAPRYDEAPELAPDIGLPELHQPPAAPEVNPYYNQLQQPYQSIKQEVPNFHPGGYGPSTATTTTFGNGQSPTYGSAQLDPGRRPRGRTFCGCSLLVFILSSIIALLSAAVIGLAAGTGVEASRANDAESSLAALKAGGATTTVTAPASTSTSDFNLLDRNCTSDSDTVTGSTYSSTFFNDATYEIHCNMDTVLAPIQSLFVGNFDDCMDACSSYSYYMKKDFSNATAANQTCSGVSFIPAWTNRTTAIRGTAPGNCYLKPGPQNETSLYTPVSGSETHAAIVVDSP